MEKIIAEILFIPISFVVCLGFAWIPMLAWNLGVTHVWSNLPKIDYWTAFWLYFALSYWKTTIITLKK